jgi:hypothetical protein
MLLMIEKQHRHPSKSGIARYPAQNIEKSKDYRPVAISIVRCHPRK